MGVPRFLQALPAVLIVGLAVAGPAAAHDHVHVLGHKYELTIGFDSEPAYVDTPNAAQVSVKNSTGAPVLNLQSTLKVEVSTGGQKVELPLATKFGVPGQYVGRFIPTQEGVYTFRFFGTINNESVDYSHPYTRDPVEARKEAEFPEAGLDNVDTASRVADLEARLARVEANATKAGNNAPATPILALLALAALGAVFARRR